MERITLPAPEPLVVRLPYPVEEVLRLPAVEPLTLQLPAPAENVLTLPMPEPLRIVLPASMIPQAPRLAAGVLTGEVTVSGVATEAARAIARAAGTLSGAASITGAAKARAVAAGGITGAGALSGVTGARAAGSVTGSGSITGKVVAKLAGVVAGAASIVSTVKTLLSGSVTGSGAVSGTAAAKAVVSGAITGEASITGTSGRIYSVDFIGTSAMPAGWTSSSPAPAVMSGAAQCPTVTATNWVTSLHGQSLGSDDMSVTVKIVAPTGTPAGEDSGIAICSGPSWTVGTHAEFGFSQANGCSIKSVSGGAFTVRASTSTNVTYGDELEFRVEGNTFRAYRNGSTTPLLTWVDTGNIITRSSARRQFGFYVAGIRSGGVTYYTPAIDWITAKDL